MKKKIIFIVNPISGTNTKDTIIDLIPETINISLYDWKVRFTEYAGHAEKIAREAVKHNIDIVVAVGGDGTVNEIARALIGSDATLGIIPCGSGNGLARHLQIPMDAENALRTLNQLNTIRADYGIINSHPFFCTCGMGFDADVSNRFAKAGKRGIFSYIEQMIQIGRTYKSEEYDIEIDGVKNHYKAFLIAVGNASQYGNNVFIAPEAELTDGMLDLVIIEPFKTVDGGQVLYQLMNRTINHRPNVHTFRAKNIKISRKSDGIIHFDGDPVLEKPEININIVPSSIKMICGNKELYGKNAMLNVLSEIRNKINSDIKTNNRRIARINKEMLSRLKNSFEK